MALPFIVAALADDLVVLKQGNLKGHRMTSRKGGEIFAFQEIPYAKPPVGELRFKSPQPAEPWTGVLDATKEAPVCVQRGFLPSDIEVRRQEDCLNLNVYKPRITFSSTDDKPTLSVGIEVCKFPTTIRSLAITVIALSEA
ncbi:hypothetical protein B7P43_G14026 [Cryptotermes secundus]|uniref:Carboxylesterase type B domain-containing protein n=1 Tax=Cryptotermes secundus TaxID=105785 RepID=A0A2J7RD57_9NEOP|nr:hypothetical protein B7P43_G14026 [Cryptotermes secundus]